MLTALLVSSGWGVDVSAFMCGPLQGGGYVWALLGIYPPLSSTFPTALWSMLTLSCDISLIMYTQKYDTWSPKQHYDIPPRKMQSNSIMPNVYCGWSKVLQFWHWWRYCSVGRFWLQQRWYYVGGLSTGGRWQIIALKTVCLEIVPNLRDIINIFYWLQRNQGLNRAWKFFDRIKSFAKHC